MKIEFNSLWYCGCNGNIAARRWKQKTFKCDSCKKDYKIKNRGKKEESDFLKKENKNREETYHSPGEALLKITI